MTLSVSWQLFPVNGSYADDRGAGSITTIIIAAVLISFAERKG
jgi:hypothetical protein